MKPRQLAALYSQAHNLMRNIDGLQPQESFDELLKYLFYQESLETENVQVPELTMLLEASGDFLPDTHKVAAQIRREFARQVKKGNSWVVQVWPDSRFRLSDKALAGIQQLFAGVNLRSLPLDIRSEALKEFMAPEMRRGLGIYLTPESVVRAMVAIVKPKAGSRVLDPACGSGTFLIEVIGNWGKSQKSRRSATTIYGVDKNPKMLLLAGLNLWHLDGLEFRGHLADALFDLPPEQESSKDNDLCPNSIDYILTNPPFGVYLDAAVYDLKRFESCVDPNGQPFSRQQSEVVFVEQCLRLLRPGGVLGIVLPRSVVTNVSDRMLRAREVMDNQGYVYAVLNLPSETFASTGTQTSTVVLFVRKFQRTDNRDEQIQIAHVDIENVGFDSTGRTRTGEELSQAVADLTYTLSSGIPQGLCTMFPAVRKDETFKSLPNLISGHSEPSKSGMTLSDVSEIIRTGRTPARSKYSSSGLFVLKVGNLTGSGISWDARDRNFVGPDEAQRRRQSGLMLENDDIVLTSSAHAPQYIAKKVDLIAEIPDWLGGEASLVGEVMLVRPNKAKVNPLALLAYLRGPTTIKRIQRMIRGQTAHLHPADLGQLPIPIELCDPQGELKDLCKILEREQTIAREQNDLLYRQQKILESLSF